MQNNTRTIPVEQLVGQIVGQYRVESLLGHGRLSAVYLAQHLENQETAALTVFPLPERLTHEERARFLQRFLREAATLTMLTHRNLLPIYEYGERFGYPYLITPHMTRGSLADVLKQEKRLSPVQALTVLEQISAGLEYMHRKNFVHGTLKTSNILRSDDNILLVAGAGMASMLQLRGIEATEQPYAHLLSIADTFLYASAYIAPEIVQGQPFDSRSDIYALGVILFELLCGKLPFVGSSPLETALLHVQQQIPSLREYTPDVPIALELIVNHALARNPDQRFQHVSELVEAFSQVCHGLASRLRAQRDVAPQSLRPATPLAAVQKSIHDMPEEEVAIGNWQLKPPIITGKSIAVHPANTKIVASEANDTDAADPWQILPPIITGRVPAVKPALVDVPQRHAEVYKMSTPVRLTEQLPMPAALSAQAVQPVPFGSPPAQPVVFNTQARLAAVKNEEQTQEQPSQQPVVTRQLSPVVPPGPLDLLAASQSTQMATRGSERRSRGGRGMSRRSVVALLATGSIAAAGAIVAFDLGLVNTNARPTATTTTTTHQAGQQGKPGTGTTTKNTGGAKVKQPGHTGTVIGKTQLTANSSMVFKNPADGKESLLIHLPSGQFVAFESACTHEGVTVHYDTTTHKIVCPAHNSIFDPAQGARVLQGPAVVPLTSVTVHVNGDGTITTA